ncbi:MAG: NAD-dependent dehydratase [Sandarakinorhabdus sp.]|jgi:uncharacterized protein YbjT (DUF2867 family)|nr:NAD-dependent dehydratase [Sandarakinorhabdus sp.]
MLVAGATGLVGGLVLGLCPAAIPVSRRPIAGRPGVVADFDDLPPLPPAEVAVCALGTTRARAGSAAAFRAVDHDAVLAFARAAKAAGVRHFILVSSVGANPKARFLYPRTKGEVERALAGMGFQRLDILQPGLLIGARAERRPVERFLQWAAPVMDLSLPRRLGSIPAPAVARAVVALCARTEPGVFRHDNRAIAAA